MVILPFNLLSKEGNEKVNDLSLLRKLHIVKLLYLNQMYRSVREIKSSKTGP